LRLVSRRHHHDDERARDHHCPDRSDDNYNGRNGFDHTTCRRDVHDPRRGRHTHDRRGRGDSFRRDSVSCFFDTAVWCAWNADAWLQRPAADRHPGLVAEDTVSSRHRHAPRPPDGAGCFVVRGRRCVGSSTCESPRAATVTVNAGEAANRSRLSG
jgi:hypothetical protein